MRQVVVSVLMATLLACPALCGADEIGHGHGHDGPVPPPTDCSGEPGDSCICRGAVPAPPAGRAALAVDPGSPWPDLPPGEMVGPPTLIPTPLLAHHSPPPPGRPTGRTLAILQSFRC